MSLFYLKCIKPIKLQVKIIIQAAGTTNRELILIQVKPHAKSTEFQKC